MEHADGAKEARNEMTDAVMAALDEAISIAGGVSALAVRVGASPSAPSMWRKRRKVPEKYCPAIEVATGVRCERLCPDVAWGALRIPEKSQDAAHA